MSERRRLAAVTMASIVAEKFPDATQWPFLSLPEFNVIATNLIQASSAIDLLLLPIVRRRDQLEFEDFAYNYFQSTPQTSQNPNVFFGKGIWSFNQSVFSTNVTIDEYNETHFAPEEMYHDAPPSDTSRGNEIVSPILHIIPSSMTMMNFYNPWSLRMLDASINCSEERALLQDWENNTCTFISVPARAIRHGNRRGAFIVEPIYPANDPTTVSVLLLFV